MGEMKVLVDIVHELHSLDEEATIYAVEPWTPDATALVAVQPPAGGLRREAIASGMNYFIEVAVAREFLDGWCSTLDHAPSVRERCERLIRYAIDDA